MEAVGALSFHKVFAENLRRLTLSRGTIARACLDLEINRQQFNRYLSGTNFPAPKILARIAAYFNVSEIELLELPPQREYQGAKPDLDWIAVMESLPSWARSDLIGMATQASGGLFRPGCYFAYYPWPADCKKVVRSVVVIAREGSAVTFQRFTRLRAIGVSSRSIHNAKHRGLVIENGGRTFFIGRNTRGYGELSLSSFGATASLGKDLFHGLALVMTPWAEPTALRTTMTYEGGHEVFRSLLKQASIGPSNDGSIPCEVIRALTTPIGESVPRIDPFHEHMPVQELVQKQPSV